MAKTTYSKETLKIIIGTYAEFVSEHLKRIAVIEQPEYITFSNIPSLEEYVNDIYEIRVRNNFFKSLNGVDDYTFRQRVESFKNETGLSHETLLLYSGSDNLEIKDAVRKYLIDTKLVDVS